MPPASEDEKEEKEEKKEEKDAYDISVDILNEIVHILIKEVRQQIEAGDFDDVEDSEEQKQSTREYRLNPGTNWIQDYTEDREFQLLEEMGDEGVKKIVKALKPHYSKKEIAEGMKYIVGENPEYGDIFNNFIEQNKEEKKAKNS